MLFIHPGSLHDGPQLTGYMGDDVLDPCIKPLKHCKYNLINIDSVYHWSRLTDNMVRISANAGTHIYEGTFSDCVAKMLELLEQMNTMINTFKDTKKTHE